MPTGPKPVSEPVWFKSSHSGGNATECVEAAFIATDVHVRDSKWPDGPRIAVSAEAWRKFLGASAR
ncbi:DUF397 domain-containing protein [Streptomyces sp. NPDC086182]|jgi:hypothetical protein|uniref:DUF397 domain-containing protein n=1 Tax=Streptomyces sp. NPDC086182 TaxID=3155058 RepID=UPI0034493C8D